LPRFTTKPAPPKAALGKGNTTFETPPHAPAGKAKGAAQRPGLRKRAVQKADGRYLIFYERL
jgi:hypothetical protein